MGSQKLERSKVCPRCGVKFQPKDWRTTHCSRTCAMTRDLPTKECAHCGHTFRKNNEYSYAVWAKIQYCSNRCNGLAIRGRAQQTCAYCGDSFESASGRLRQPYCSRACYWLSLRTERYPTAHRPREQEFSLPTRKALISRSNGKCGICGAEEHLEFDHIIPCHAGGTADESNGQVLCRKCHREKTSRELRELFSR